LLSCFSGVLFFVIFCYFLLCFVTCVGCDWVLMRCFQFFVNIGAVKAFHLQCRAASADDTICVVCNRFMFCFVCYANNVIAHDDLGWY
jgi:hypothetical protein